jgi:L-asparaginase II
MGADNMRSDPAGLSPGVPLAAAWRGGLIESVHFGHVAVVDPRGRLIQSRGDPEFPTFLRSCAKPLQALAVLETGAAEAYGFEEPELAAMCGSLNGQDFQVAVVRSILAKIGLDENYLKCGPQRPSHRPTAKELQRSGQPFGAIHNNCAGKHAAMLAVCRHLGHPVADYDAPDHPVQRLILTIIAETCAVPREAIGIGVDGCGVPVFRLPLQNLARAYAGLANPEAAGWSKSRRAAVGRLMAAALAHPEMIAGDERLCTSLMRAAPGRLLAKVGGEGSYAVAWPERGLGIALKITDGAMRALGPAIISLLHTLGALSDEESNSLESYARPPVKNHRGEVVGRLAPPG